MSEQDFGGARRSSREARGRWSPGRAVYASAVGALAVLWGARWSWRSHALYEWDSAQYALGILRFDVRDHRPHPPGYPLWIALLKGAHLFIRDLNTAQIALDFVVTSVAVALFYRLARRLHGAAPALLAAGLLLFSPTILFYSAVASTYPADLLISVVLGALSARLWRGDKEAGITAVFAIALLAGVRQSGAVMMAPLVGVSLARAYRLDVRRWAVAAVVVGVTFATWYVPTAMMNGGIVSYQSFASHTIRGYFHATSVLFGAPVENHLEMLRNDATWTGAALAVAVLASAAVWSTGMLVGQPGTPATVGRVARSTGALTRAEPRVSVTFLLLWSVPNALYVTLLHAIKPGYLVLDLPPVFFLLGGVAAKGLDRIEAKWQGTAPIVAAVVALTSALMTTVITGARYGGALDRTSLASVRDSDQDMRELEALVANGPGPASTMIVVLLSGLYGPNVRSLAVHLPEATVAVFAPDGDYGIFRKFLRDEYLQDEGEKKVIPSGVRRILWLHPQTGGVLGAVRRGFPGTHVVQYGRTVRVFESDLGEEELDALVSLDRRYHLVRAGTVPRTSCRLGAGFIDPVEGGELLWGAGPWSEIVVDQGVATPIHLSMRVEADASSEEVITIVANDIPIGVVRPRIGAETVLDVAGVSGQNRIRLEYSRYNHHPDEFAPRDPRPFAVAFREIRCRWGEEERTLFSL